MDDLAPAAGSRSLTPPASASSSHEGPHTISPPGTDGFRLPTMAPASISFEAESLMSSMVIPDDWLETVGPPWRLYSAAALARALQEIEKPVVDRSTAIAVTSALTLIMKDFSMENDERRIKSSAIQMAVVLAHSLAEVTSREPMRKHFTKYLREELERRDVRVFEDTLKECVTENLDFACTLITQSTISRTTREMEESIATELEKRQTVPWNNSDSPVLRHWLNLIPGPSKVDPISREQSSPTFTSERGPTHPSESAPTDSGYGSASHAKTVDGQIAAGEQGIIPHIGGARTEGTVYSSSVASDLPAARDRGYISNLSAELSRSLNAQQLSEQKLRDIADRLPELLKAFALKLGYRAQTQAHRDVSYFVQKHRKLIQEDFQELFLPTDDEDSEDEKLIFQAFAIDRFLGDSANTPGPEAQGTGNTFIDPESPQQTEEESSESEGDEDLSAALPAPGPYREFIVNSPAYRWLVATLERESSLARTRPDIMHRIRESILAELPSDRRVSRRLPSSEHEVVFHLDWDPVGFVKEQQYVEKPSEALANAITLTGLCDDAQALTSLGYLSQIWPTTGESIMHVLCNAVRSGRGSLASSMLSDGTEVAVLLDGFSVIVSALGTADSLVEVGQQFAWLGAALRSSPYPTDIAECTPIITTVLQTSEVPADDLKQKKSTNIFWKISYKIQKSTSPERQPGQCWRGMFRNPVIVQGYPILAKHERSLGLEMPLNMMAGLIGSSQVTTFDEKTFVKGFSAMLVAVRSTRDLLVWHYSYDEQGERISYNDHGLQIKDTNNINLSDVSTMRQVVGWCAGCTFHAGAADANYNIRGTGLPRPHAGCILEKVSLTGGKIITGGMSFAVGAKDTPIRLTRNGYIPMLQWISTKYVVLWDEEEKKGWLINGTSALLHLVRTSLKHYSEDDFSSAFLFDASKMEDQMDHKPNSAVRVLISDQNRDLEIYPGSRERFDQEESTQTDGSGGDIKSTRKRGYFLFEDLVKQHLNNLEQIIDYQRRSATQDGVKVKMRVRKHLEGWDFAELATDHDPYARVATLQAMGYGWVDFVRSIGAVVLFGRGFGEIIRPAQCGSEMCLDWKSLPSHRYYLAVSMADLSKIMSKHGDPAASPPRPVHELLWHSPNGVLSACSCLSRDGWGGSGRHAMHRHHDPVQVFYPRTSELVLRSRLRGPERLEPSGAVVFGHNVSWRYRWTEAADGTLERGEPSPSSSTTTTTTTTMASSSAFSSARPPGPPVMSLAPWSAPTVFRSDSATASGTSRDEDSSAGATSSTGITSPQARGASPLSLSTSDVASASGSGQHSEHTDDDQRARTRRMEKRRMQK